MVQTSFEEKFGWTEFTTSAHRWLDFSARHMRDCHSNEKTLSHSLIERFQEFRQS